jgi:CheY-like chemotaxis protein
MSGPVLKAKVLVVDDGTDFPAALREHLGRNFQEVDQARSESEALALVERKSYDLLIMDIILDNDTGGMRLCRALKADQRRQRIPVMILSAADVRYGMSIKSCLDDGRCLPADDFVDKGAEVAQVVERARRLVERPGM